MIVVRVSFERTIQECIEPVQSRMRHKSSVFSLLDFDAFVGAFLLGRVATFFDAFLEFGGLFYRLVDKIFGAFLIAFLATFLGEGEAFDFTRFGIELYLVC